MTHTDTKTKKRYTLREVQQIASTTYGLLIQSLNTNSRAPYGIWFEGQLVWQCNTLKEVVECLPKLYTSIQEQLAEQQKAIAPSITDAIAVSTEEVAPPATTDCISTETALAHPTFSYQAYESVENWELRERLNSQGYKDGLEHREPAHLQNTQYMAGYYRGVRDRPVRV